MNADIYRAGSKPSAFSRPASFLPWADMQSVLIGSEYPVMDTLLFYFPQSSYCNLFRGVAECYAFSCFRDNVGLRDFSAIRHIKGADAVIVNNDALVGNAVLLFSVRERIVH